MTRALLSILASPEPPASPELLKALRPYGFKNPMKAWKEMSSFFQNPFDRESWGAVVPLMLVEFSKSADPDLSLAQFVTFTENSFHRTQLFEYLLKAPSAREALAKIFGLSPYLASILYQQPALLYWLFDEDGLYSKFSKVRLLEAMGSEVGTADDLEGKLNALRRVKKRQMLRIGARDLLGLADVKQLTFELSGLADGLLEMTSRLGQEKLGPPRPAAVSWCWAWENWGVRNSTTTRMWTCFFSTSLTVRRIKKRAAVITTNWPSGSSMPWPTPAPRATSSRWTCV